MTRADIAKEGADLAAVGITVGALAEILPAIAAVFAIIWTAIRIYEWSRVRLFGKEPTKGATGG